MINEKRNEEIQMIVSIIIIINFFCNLESKNIF